MDPPLDPAHFIHRIGRTGRFSRAGKTLVLLVPSEKDYLGYLKVFHIWNPQLCAWCPVFFVSLSCKVWNCPNNLSLNH